MQIWTILIVATASSFLEFFYAIPMFNLAQLEGYKYVRAGRQKELFARICCCGVAVLGVGYICNMVACTLGVAYAQYFSLPFAAWLICYFIYSNNKQKIKPQIAYTSRMKRLLTTFALLVFGANIALLFLGLATKIQGNSLLLAYFPFVMIFFQMFVQLSLLINYPLEKMIKSNYKKACERSLKARENLQIVGITGSCGKTSVKQILTHILATKFKVFATPFNYNTPMGICKSAQIMPSDTEIFLVEMGARNVGDIKEICDFVHPTCGIITGVAAQHLATFGDMESIARTKFELVDSLGENGFAVINCNNAWCKNALYGRKCKKFALGIDQNICAKNIICDENGGKFDLIIDGETFSARTQLIGKHNVDNIILAVAMARHCGMDGENIVKAITTIPQVDHRLQRSRTPSGITIIDDGYNSNPDGARLALETLGLFVGRKIVASQGLVELGAKEVEENYILGQKIAEIADIAILIGRNAYNLQKGVLSKNFDKNKIFLTDSLAKAQELFATLLKSGDVLLLQNDLPDNY